VISPRKPTADRRIQRTRRLLREALGSLIHEKAYDAISVREILERANIGRSTFYMHFHDKDELLVSGIRDMLGSVPPTEPPSSAKRYERIVEFSLPIFKHIGRHRRAGTAKMGARGRAVIHEHLQRVIVERISAEVARAVCPRRKASEQLAPDLVVQYVATTFILVLNWWVENRNALTPEEVNDLFRRLIMPGLAAACA